MYHLRGLHFVHPGHIRCFPARMDPQYLSKTRDGEPLRAIFPHLLAASKPRLTDPSRREDFPDSATIQPSLPHYGLFRRFSSSPGSKRGLTPPYCGVRAKTAPHSGPRTSKKSMVKSWPAAGGATLPVV